MNMKRSIATDLGILFLFVALIPILVGYHIAGEVLRTAMEKQAVESLSAVADGTRDRIEDYINERVVDITTLSRLDLWRQLLASPEILVNPPPSTHSYLDAFIQEKGYHDMLLIDIDGTIRYSIKKERDLGQNIYQGSFVDTQLPSIIEAANTLLQTEISDFRYYPPSGESAAFLAAPIFSSRRIVGNIILQIDNNRLYGIINRFDDLGKTGEVITATNTAEGISFTAPSRHAPASTGVVAVVPGFSPLAMALSGNESYARYVDYRGKEVIGQWRYLPSLNWALVAKMDVDELLSPVTNVMVIAEWIMMFSILLALGGVVLSYLHISSPLVRFSRSVRGLDENNLPESVDVEGHFEIADLGHSFNALLKSLHRYQKEMEHRVVERTEDMGRALQVAEAANKAKSQFLANMSHEIRTPLNGVIGFTDLLLQTPLDKTQHEYATIARQSGASLLGIVNDILDLSKIEAGRLELERVPMALHEVLEQSIDVLRFTSDRKGIKLQLFIPDDVPAMIMGDPLRLRQVLLNLLNNAVKFTDKGDVTLQVFHEPAGSYRSRLTFTVRDTGIGISDEQRQKLFQVFSQADASTTRRYGGTGLGLIISNLLLHKMGSYIQLESSLGVGSVFSFTLEVDLPKTTVERPPSEVQKESIPIALASATNFHVLIADDVVINLMLVRSLLNKLLPGVQVYEAFNGRDAVAMYQAQRMNLILMDVHMPECDGLEATRRIRELEAGGGYRVPIIGLSAAAYNEEREKAITAGMNGYLTKPLDARDLSTLLHDIVV